MQKSFFAWTSTNTETYYYCTATQQLPLFVYSFKNVFYFVAIKRNKLVFLNICFKISSHLCEIHVAKLC